MFEDEEDFFRYIKNQQIGNVDFCYTNELGHIMQISYAAQNLTRVMIDQGIKIDGGSVFPLHFKIDGMQDKQLILQADVGSSFIDHFSTISTIKVFCNIMEIDENGDLISFILDPRAVAKRADDYLESCGDINFHYIENISTIQFNLLDSNECDKLNAVMDNRSNGYGLVRPYDDMSDIRLEMVRSMLLSGIKVINHVCGYGSLQHEITFRSRGIVRSSDDLQKSKYIIRNIARAHGKIAYFMPKPGINMSGNGLIIHQKIYSGENNLFISEDLEEREQSASYYVGGIIDIMKAINMIANPSINSYKRITEDFLGYQIANGVTVSERIMKAYGINVATNNCGNNKDESVTIDNDGVTISFADLSANPYYVFGIISMAGIRGIQERILSDENSVKALSSSLQESIENFEKCKNIFIDCGILNETQIINYIRLIKLYSTVAQREVGNMERKAYEEW